MADRAALFRRALRPAARLTAIAALVAAVIVVPAQSASADDPHLTTSISPLNPSVPSGAALSYLLNVQCSNPLGCGTVTMIVPAPPGWTAAADPTDQSNWPNASLSQAQIDAGFAQSIDPATGELTITWTNAPVGQSQNIQVNWPTHDYYTAPGAQPVTVTATDTMGDDATASGIGGITAVPNLQLFKFGPDIANAGQPVTYQISATNTPANPNSTNGNLAVTNVVVTDAIPAGSTFVSCTDGCTFNAATGVATWPPFSLIPTQGIQTYYHFITVTLPANAPAGSAQVDHATATGTPVGGGTPVTAQTDKTTTIQDVGTPVFNPGLTKNAAQTTIMPGETFGYTVNFSNNGNVPAVTTVTDTIPAGYIPNDTSIYDGSTQTNLSGVALHVV
jgi:uncharacterized repeat protein (TIGR01451 family)